MKMLYGKFNNNEIALKDYMYGMVTNTIVQSMDGYGLLLFFSIFVIKQLHY